MARSNTRYSAKYMAAAQRSRERRKLYSQQVLVIREANARERLRQLVPLPGALTRLAGFGADTMALATHVAMVALAFEALKKPEQSITAWGHDHR